jgi:hypothetical protein
MGSLARPTWVALFTAAFVPDRAARWRARPAGGAVGIGFAGPFERVRP